MVIPYKSNKFMANICLRMPNWVGDVVMSTPILPSLKKSFPDSLITAVISSNVKDVIKGIREIDHVIPYERHGVGLATTRHFLSCVSKIRKTQSDLAIILPNSFSSAFMMFLAGVPKRLGYERDMRGKLLTNSIPRPVDADGCFKPIFMARYYLKLCELIGVETDNVHPYLKYSEKDMVLAKKKLTLRGVDPDGELILLHPHAGYGPAKLWPEAYFCELTKLLDKEFSAQIAFIGGPGAAHVVDGIREKVDTKTFDLVDCGIDLHLLKCVVGLSNLLISTDSGPRHYGIALDIPTICLMGPTSPAYTDSGFKHDVVVRVNTDCGPCQKKVCRNDHRCMTRITPEMVLVKAEQLLY